jgi:hypothetical protein
MFSFHCFHPLCRQVKDRLIDDLLFSPILPLRKVLNSWLTCMRCLVSLSLSDEDFGKLVNGKANAQRLFMSGKLKVKGDVMKATKMEPILKKAQSVKAKL